MCLTKNKQPKQTGAQIRAKEVTSQTAHRGAPVAEVAKMVNTSGASQHHADRRTGSDKRS